MQILLVSSLLFLTNAGSAWYTGYYLYGTLFCGLTMTSLLVHSNHAAKTYDNFFIAGVVLYGSYLLCQKGAGNLEHACLVVLLFFSVLVMYLYGRATSQFCFHPDRGNEYHSLLHCLSSFGHHLIVFL
jgi:hypothetical protein